MTSCFPFQDNGVLTVIFVRIGFHGGTDADIVQVPVSM